VILPTKHVKTSQSLIGIGAGILQVLVTQQTVTRVWEVARLRSDKITFERFILALDFLYCIGCIELRDGLLRRKNVR
jgi:hypothetical protein